MTTIVARSTSSLKLLNPFVVATIVCEGETLVALSKGVAQATAALKTLWMEYTFTEFDASEVQIAVLDKNEAAFAEVL